MNLLKYIERKIEKKRARRITKEYSSTVQTFDLPIEGPIQFANWDNPLVKPVVINQDMVDFFKKYISPGDLVIDIGANIGDTTVPMALAAGQSGLTLGFDPNPLVFKILSTNAALNPKKQNIVPLRYAITVHEEEFYYISSEASFGNGGISPTTQSIHGKFVYPEKIKGINLENYLTTHYSEKMPRLSFIKIDTEGYDKEILKSISGLLKKFRPVVVAEVFGKNSISEKAELFDILSNLNYTVSYFEDFFASATVLEIKNNREIGNWKKTINIVGIPAGFLSTDQATARHYTCRS